MSEDYDLKNPKSRVESYLNVMLGQMEGGSEEYDLSRPQSRVEAYLYNMIGQMATISKKKGFDYKVVTTLPTEGEEGVIYYILSDHGDTNDLYDEHMWINGKPEKIGTAGITGDGTLPQLTTTVVDGTLEISFDQGTLPTKDDADVVNGITSAAFTGEGVMINGSFTGKEMSSTGTFTPAGKVAAPTFTGKAMSSTGKFTPAGTVAAPEFTGNELASSGSYTPAGTVAAPEFTGTQVTIESK